MRLGIATCQKRPGLEPDDALLLDALDGVEVAVAPWDDPRAWGSCDALLLRSVWDYHRRVEEFVDWAAALERSGTPVWNDAATVRWNARKSYLGELAAAGLPTVPTLELETTDFDGWADTILGSCWSEVVLKPVVGASAYLTWRSSAREAATRFDRLEKLAEQGGALVQPFVAEVLSAGEWSLIYFEGELSHAVRKRAASGEFRVQVESGGSETLEEPPPALAALGARALELAPSPPLYARADAIETATGFVLSELELIEPVLFLGASERAGERFSRAIRRRLGSIRRS